MTIATLRASLARRFRKWWGVPWLDWIQIEVTSRCNASCTYCPRTVYRSHWINEDISLAIFERLLPVFTKTKMVHLQGWGEPFLHKDFFEMVARAKKTGTKVSTTTNGMLLDREKIIRCVESGMDHIAFSLTGIDEKNDRVRKATECAKVLQAISDLDIEKKALRVETPEVNVAYLLFRSHLPDIDRIVPMLKGRGIRNVIISTLDFIPSRDFQEECLSPQNEREYEKLKSILDRLAREGERAGLQVHYCLAPPGTSNRMCMENAERALFVSADGNVSPCVFTNIPASGACHMMEGGEHAYQQLRFGAVADVSLPAIWLSPPYKAFRDSFAEKPHPICRTCPKLY
jgi:MoaA/NifB/PqqE/SkfB family radical SAM enzyme